MKAFSGIIELMAAVVIFFLFPAAAVSGQNFRTARMIAELNTSSFAEVICAHGYLTQEDYAKYLQSLSGLGLEGTAAIKRKRSVYEKTAGIWFEEESGVDEIRIQLEEHGAVIFRKGDYLTVSFSGRPDGMAGILYRSKGAPDIRIEAGGVIRDETWPVSVDLS